MKIMLLFLLLLNGLFFGWSQWVAKTPHDLAVATPEPDAEQLVLFAEKFPERARKERDALEKIARDQRLADQAAGDTQVQADRAIADAQLADDVSDATAVEAPVQSAQTEPPPPATDETPDATVPTVPTVESPSPVATQDPLADDGDLPPAAPVTRDTALAALDTLASETPPATASSLMTQDGPPTTRCVQLGPFVNLRNAAQATAAIRNAGLDPTQRLEDAQVWVGHWVHLPPAESRAAAVATVEKLRIDGVSDIYIEPAGELRHSISLGLFSDAEGAEIRAGKIRKLGVRPQIRDRFRDGTVYWVDFDLAAGQNVDPARFSDSTGREITLRERDCGENQSASVDTPFALRSSHLN